MREIILNILIVINLILIFKNARLLNKIKVMNKKLDEQIESDYDKICKSYLEFSEEKGV